MSNLIVQKDGCYKNTGFNESFYKNTRNLSLKEIEILKKNGNSCCENSWDNILIKNGKNFSPDLIKNCEFYGKIVIGNVEKAVLHYHDLELDCGLYNSQLKNVVIEDDVCIRNVAYLENYYICSQVILFNIGEMSCTCHGKFGNGVIKSGEQENVRIKISVGNENEKRAILPFETMTTADAYLWAKYRDRTEVMEYFVNFTEALHNPTKKTWGVVGAHTVIKQCATIKDVKFGNNAYVKGALKLKNITVCSSQDAPSQIGEGVELVNGIVGYGSKVFYQAVAVRFVIGQNCQVKYGARLLNTVLGDNSTVSCCELLNNLLFPFHEQHHNTSFLIATIIQGQANIAAGATIGSNHNSRSPDGEICAGRGFWPGLSSDFKHNSKFASFSLISKNSYQQELYIMYPFSLVSLDARSQEVIIIPAYWFLYNMYGIVRNNTKFKNRDKRVYKIQHIETNPLAPDTMEEILFVLNRIIFLTAKKFRLASLQEAKDFLHQHPFEDLVLEDSQVQKKYGGRIVKAAHGYKEYRKIAKYFAVKSLMDYCQLHNEKELSFLVIEKIVELPLYTKWQNVGGQIIPQKKLDELFEKITEKKVSSWEDVHSFYNDCEAHYLNWKAHYGIYLLEELYSRPILNFSTGIFEDIYKDVVAVSNYMYKSAINSRKKDYSDFYRSMVYDNEEEMEAILGTLEDVEFLHELEKDTEMFNKGLEILLQDLMKNQE